MIFLSGRVLVDIYINNWKKFVSSVKMAKWFNVKIPNAFL